MLTLRHIRGTHQFKQQYGLRRRGELDHQDAAFEGPAKHSRTAARTNDVADRVTLELDIVKQTGLAPRFIIK